MAGIPMSQQDYLMSGLTGGFYDPSMGIYYDMGIMDPDRTKAIQEKEAADRLASLTGQLKSAPGRSIAAIDPTKMQSYNMYRNLAMGTGPTAGGALQRQQIGFQRGTEMDAATRASAMARAVPGASRESVALQGMGRGLAGAQGVQEGTGNRLLEALKQDQTARLGGLQNLTGMTNKWLAEKQKLGLDLYEQDINRYAAAQQAKAMIG